MLPETDAIPAYPMSALVRSIEIFSSAVTCDSAPGEGSVNPSLPRSSFRYGRSLSPPHTQIQSISENSQLEKTTTSPLSLSFSALPLLKFKSNKKLKPQFEGLRQNRPFLSSISPAIMVLALGFGLKNPNSKFSPSKTMASLCVVAAVKMTRKPRKLRLEKMKCKKT